MLKTTMKYLFRSFIALPLPDNFLKEMCRIQQDLRARKLMHARWVPAEKMHITLKFLGDQTEEQLQAVEAWLKKVPVTPLTLEPGQPGVFSPRRIRVLWCGLADDGPVRQLQREVDAALEGLFPVERDFKAHITLARVKRVERREELMRAVRETAPRRDGSAVRRFLLMTSELTPQGAVYTVRREFAAKP